MNPNPVVFEEQTKALALDRNIDKLVDSFIESQDVRANSKNTYRRSLKGFLAWIIKNSINTPTRNEILQYKAYLSSKIENDKLSALTASNYLVSVRKFYEWAEGMKLYPNIAKGIKGFKRAKGFRKDPLTVGQIKELFKIVDTSTLQGKRDYALLNLLVRTGLRTIEIVRANIEDIRQESGEAILDIQGKGRDSKDDFVLLTDSTLKPILAYLQVRGSVEDKAPLFTSLSDRNKNQRLTTKSISRIVKAYLRAINLDSKKLTAHSLRHTAITLSLKAGATIQEAQALGRHADINTTMIYAHNIDRIKNAPERKIEELLSNEIMSE